MRNHCKKIRFRNTEIYSRNRNAWIEKKKSDLFNVKKTCDWIFFPDVSSRPIFVGREIKNSVFVSTSSLLKKFADLWNRELPPLLESIRSLVQLALHMRRCGMLRLVSACSAYSWLVEDAKHVLVLIPCRWNAGWLCTHRCAHNLPPRRVIGSQDSRTCPVHKTSKKTLVQISPLRAFLT